MKFKFIQADISRNKATTAITILFIAIATMLISLSASLAISLSGSIDRLMEDAKTPHFMQMHSGELNPEKLKAFSRQNGNVADFQIVKFLNLDNSRILLGETSLSGNLQDNGVCVQNEQFDFLLDLDQNRIQPKAGEVYVPVFFWTISFSH